ncbi:MAG: hypothetical protein H0X37_19875 [Herpetosiphonaceae bacterium]|nr:hypothetical protein [Herpetosiphonaceae bacterium]
MLPDLLRLDDYYGYAALLRAGLTPPQAFDLIAERVTGPALQAIIEHLESSSEGRQVLALVRGYWEAERVPVPTDQLVALRAMPPEEC